MPRTTYYRWQVRDREGRLADEVVVPYRRAAPPTAQERQAICGFALTHPQMGYKRLTWQMVDEDVVYLRPYQVYSILSEQDLLYRQCRPAIEALRTAVICISSNDDLSNLPGAWTSGLVTRDRIETKGLLGQIQDAL